MSGVRRTVPIGVLAGLFFAASSYCASITIDPTREYQTIDGFGAFGYEDVNWCGGKPACLGVGDQSFWTMLVSDWGLTISRQEYYAPSDSLVTDATWAQLAPAHQALQAAATAAGEPLKFFFTVWSPPSMWKSNGSKNNGGALLPSHYRDYANLLVQAVEQYKNIGIDLYGLSFQNEPAFSETYSSCVYSSQTYHDMLDTLGPVLRGAFPNVKIIGAEDMLTNLSSMLVSTLKDSTTAGYLDILACHGYVDGSNPVSTSVAASAWTKFGALGKKYGNRVWMTETSGYPSGWAGAYQLAEAMYAGLKYGNISAWLYWQASTDIIGDVKYYATKQFYRYVRPGMVAIEATESSADSSVHALAFREKTKGELVVVLLNSGADSTSVSLSGELPADFTLYRSDAGTNCANQGAVGAASAIGLPSRGIVTLVGDNYAPSGVIERGAFAKVNQGEAFTGIVRFELYSLSGRHIVSFDKTMTGPGAGLSMGDFGLKSKLPGGAVYIGIVRDRLGNVKRGIVVAGSLR